VRLGPLDREALRRRMVRLAAGDRAELEPLFTELWPLLSRFAGRMLPAADADDAAQEALVKVFRRAADFRPDADVVAWALGIAAYECLSARRRVQRRGIERLDACLIDDRPTPEQSTIVADLEAAAAEVLAVLRPEDRMVILAAVTGARGAGPARGATVRKRLQRALERLRAAWRARHGADRE
jgi:RNA polymerase sigma-70 factor (ECF subfamily)